MGASWNASQPAAFLAHTLLPEAGRTSGGNGTSGGSGPYLHSQLCCASLCYVGSVGCGRVVRQKTCRVGLVPAARASPATIVLGRTSHRGGTGRVTKRAALRRRQASYCSSPHGPGRPAGDTLLGRWTQLCIKQESTACGPLRRLRVTSGQARPPAPRFQCWKHTKLPVSLMQPFCPLGEPPGGRLDVQQ